ncbi:MAG: hypothetical protein EPO23_12510 [Xanthobacteraceae bacterium]|nr:MAG: hypothetical protein EPO23_12510 [Xanthobacteraceae bacterium]
MATILARILHRHGQGVLEDRRCTLGLLRDHAPNETRGIRLLMAAYDMDLPKKLTSESGAASEFRIEQEVSRLVADSGLQSDLARWAADVWSSAILGTTPDSAAPRAAVATAAAAASPASAAAKSMSVDDLTWGDDAPATPQATGAAPAAAPPIAPSYAPAPSAAAPANAANIATLAKKPTARYGLIAVAIVSTIFGLKSYIGTGGETPAPTQPTTQPVQPAPTQPAQPTQPANPSQPNLVVASASDDVSDWPEFSGAAHPNNNSNQWQFQFNLRFGDGRIMAYNVFVDMDGGGRSGTGSVRALDSRHLNGGSDMVSSTPSLPVTRELQSSSKIYFNRIVTSSWAKNPSRAPNVCVVFSSGNQQRFSPDNGIFCAFELQGNTCGQKIGCGRL